MRFTRGEDPLDAMEVGLPEVRGERRKTWGDKVFREPNPEGVTGFDVLFIFCFFFGVMGILGGAFILLEKL